MILKTTIFAKGPIAIWAKEFVLLYNIQKKLIFYIVNKKVIIIYLNIFYAAISVLVLMGN